LSMAAYLRDRARLAHRDASEWVRSGRFLLRYTSIADAAISRRLSGSQISAIRSVVTRSNAGVLDDTQDWLIETLELLTAADTEQACHRWRERADAITDTPEPKIPTRSLRTASLDDGTLLGRFVLDPAAAAAFTKALGIARHWDGTTDTRSVTDANADAFVDILAFFNANHDRAGTPRHRPHLELVLDHGDTNATTTDGRTMPAHATDAFLCDCVIHRVVRARSTVLDFGRATRSVPTPLFRATAHRDGGCRFPGCDRPVAWCDAHHIRWWRNHGETKLDNLLLLCNRHHHLVHRDRWDVTLHADSSATFTSITGTTLTSAPRARPTIRAA
ncbi:MAG: HNH endonuclease signature motif containing protein, partial [Ilumatobacteraceae bacterium]